MNVQIIQPIVPEYRIPFFTTLIENGDHNVCVFASKQLPNDQSIKTAVCIGPSFRVNYPCTGFLNNRLMWQNGIALDPNSKSGDVLVVCGNARFLSNYPLLWKAKRITEKLF